MAEETFDQAIHRHAGEIADLVISKQHDYGPFNILNAPFGAEKGLVVRLHDKLARLTNLLEKGVEAKNESLTDTWRDIVGYGLVGLMVKEGDFTKPLEK